MTLGEFRKYTAGLPDETEIILQKDSEGNGYSPCYGADSDAVYIPETTFSGQVYSLDSSHEDNCMDGDEWETIKLTRPKCLVLYPTN